MSTVNVKRLVPPRVGVFLFNNSGPSNPSLFQVNSGIEFGNSFAKTNSLLNVLDNLQYKKDMNKRYVEDSNPTGPEL